MAFPTATITQGSGLTINTLPNAGQATMANSLPITIASDQGAVPVKSQGASIAPIVTPTVTSNGVYAAGRLIGGVMTFPISGLGSGQLVSLRVTSKSILTTAMKAYIFTANPTSSTFTDNVAPAINVADISSLLIPPVPLGAPDSSLGTCTVWGISGVGAQFVAANLYLVLVLVSAATLTSSSTSDISVQLGVSLDG